MIIYDCNLPELEIKKPGTWAGLATELNIFLAVETRLLNIYTKKKPNTRMPCSSFFWQVVKKIKLINNQRGCVLSPHPVIWQIYSLFLEVSDHSRGSQRCVHMYLMVRVHMCASYIYIFWASPSSCNVQRKKGEKQGKARPLTSAIGQVGWICILLTGRIQRFYRAKEIQMPAYGGRMWGRVSSKWTFSNPVWYISNLLEHLVHGGRGCLKENFMRLPVLPY